MFCWQARRRLGAMEKGAEVSPGADLRRHLQRCQACRVESAALAAAVRLLEEAASAADQTLRLDEFEDRVLRAARARAGGEASRPAGGWRLPAWGPVPLAAALGLAMLASTVMLSRFVPAARPADPAPAAAASLEVEGIDLADRLAPPREIPFTLHEDLIGDRHGRIPVTTYVLEPPPAEEQEDRVVRASL
ncbi:MAG TPA: hypothetical protein VJV23_09565 [Candidatus Polarisedimenticolia bacterium]|nr:hypothetical protein [Candidatus Polarisedimenticolia bacterium]